MNYAEGQVVSVADGWSMTVDMDASDTAIWKNISF